MKKNSETIVAVATPPGRGGVGVLRISGPLVNTMTATITGKTLTPRMAHYARFRDPDGNTIDQGLAILFPGPNSFTGEDILELQGHGGQVILDMLLERIVQLGARLARPGEFSQRAFLNDKMDLTQAEAIADLIDAQSRQAARLAMRSLDGEFSQQVTALVEQLIYLRIYLEAAIDFPEEEIDFLSDGKVSALIEKLQSAFVLLLQRCQQGSVLREGIRVVIAGKPNAGKSSLLNALSGRDSAIVTDIPGTTRDVLREHIVLDGLPVHLVDTAGLRVAQDRVEQIGIERARQEIDAADLVLLMIDASTSAEQDAAKVWPSELPLTYVKENTILIRNKVDLTGEAAGKQSEHCFALCAKTGQGLEPLISQLKRRAGLVQEQEGLFLARRRHLDALTQAQQLVNNGAVQLKQFRAAELLAEDLRQAQMALNEITGEFTSDDLLGRIFSSFCIGK